MIVVIAFAAGILTGALAVAVLNRLGADIGGHLPRILLRRRPEDTAASRDFQENAGGARRLRTHPSWRDRLEQPRQESPR